MYNLLASATAFVLLHRAVSGSPVRGLIVGRIGELAYGRLFQIVSIAGLVWLAVAYAGANQPAVAGQLWSASPLVRHLQLIIQPLALLLIVTGFTTPNPGTFRQEAVAEQPDIVHGILRVTRHLFVGRGVVISGALAVGSVAAKPCPVRGLARCRIDRRGQHRRQATASIGPKWTAFASRSSNIPFAAILAGRQPLRLDELGWTNIIAVAALSAMLVLTHSFLFNVPAAG